MNKGVKVFFALRTYFKNTRFRLLRILYQKLYQRIMKNYCCEIPLNVHISETTVFPHQFYGIFISGWSIIGENCTIFQQVTIGSNTLNDSPGKGAPKIGNNVYIGAGAKIIGEVNIGDNARIGANCVVVDNVPANSTVVLEKPRIIFKEYKYKNEFVSIDNLKK